MTPTPSEFDADYYAHDCGRPYERSAEWLRFFGSIAERIVRDVNPRSVLDAGCAMGFLVEALRERGVEAFGIDISEFAIHRVHPSVQPYCRVDSVTAPLLRSYDLIVCIEVLEHLPPQEAESAIANLCEHGSDVLFSSTPFDYGEATHLNVHSPEHWAELFARHGFFRDVDFDASFVSAWAVCFRRRAEPAHRVIRDYERKYWRLAKENLDLRAHLLEMRNSTSWHLALRLQRLRAKIAPAGSLRDRWLRVVRL
jgi:SAM-dependent methyltransferase